MNGRKPAGLLHNHVQIISITQLKYIFPDPAEFDRLPFQRVPGDSFHFSQDAQAEYASDQAYIIKQRSKAEKEERITGIDRKRNAVQHVQCGTPAPGRTAVLDVVVNQHGVVKQFYGDRRMHSVGWVGAESARSRDADAWPHHFAGASAVIAQQLVQMPT